jgi:hypothetical protein
VHSAELRDAGRRRHCQSDVDPFGSVTHAFDQSQRLVPLTFSQAANGVSIAFPATGMIAPPGPYMLFLVNGKGVPSEGQIVLLRR